MKKLVLYLCILLQIFSLVALLPKTAFAANSTFKLEGSGDTRTIVENGTDLFCNGEVKPGGGGSGVTTRTFVYTKGMRPQFQNKNDTVGYDPSSTPDLYILSGCAQATGIIALVFDTNKTLIKAFLNEGSLSGDIVSLNISQFSGVTPRSSTYIRVQASLESGEPFVYGGKSWTIHLLDNNGVATGPNIDIAMGWPLQAYAASTDLFWEQANDPVSKAQADEGKFRSKQDVLPDGTYQVSIDINAEDLLAYYANTIKNTVDNLKYTGFLGPVMGLGAAAKLADIQNFLKDNITTGKPRFVGEGTVEITNGVVDPDPLDITVSYVYISPLSQALSGAISTLGSWVQASLKWVMGQVKVLLESTADYVVGPVGCNQANGECGMLGPWTAMRNIGLTLLVLALIIIAFANVLQIDIEQYGLNRMIPKIIISIILAFASWLIVTFFFDLSKAIQDQSIALLDSGGGGGYGGLTFMQSLSISTPSAGNIMANAGSVLLLLIILVGVLICGVVLLFTLILRIVMLSFLLAVAPLAFILNIVPFTANMYKQWWTEFWKWMFMGPIALVIISLGAVIAASATKTPSSGGFGSAVTIDAAMISTDSGGRMLIGLIIFAGAMYMGATLPMQWGGKIMQGWGKFGKNAWGKTGGAAIKAGRTAAWGATGGRAQNYLKERFGGRMQSVYNRDARMAKQAKARSLQNGKGQFAAGMDDFQAAAYRDQQENAIYGEYKTMDDFGKVKEAYTNAKQRKDGITMRALARVSKDSFQDIGKLYAEDGQVDARTGEWIGDVKTVSANSNAARDRAAKDPNFVNQFQTNRSFRKFVTDDSQGLALQIATTDHDLETLNGISSKNAGKSYADKDKDWYGFLGDQYDDKKDGTAGSKTIYEAARKSAPIMAAMAQAQKDNVDLSDEGKISKFIQGHALTMGTEEGKQLAFHAKVVEDAEKTVSAFNGDSKAQEQFGRVANDKQKGKMAGLQEAVTKGMGKAQAGAAMPYGTAAEQNAAQAAASAENTHFDSLHPSATVAPATPAGPAPVGDARVENPELARRLAEQENKQRNGL